MPTQETTKCPNCNSTSLSWSRSCGVKVCDECDHHLGLVRCFCGWALDGGNGYQQLIEEGETIDEEY